MRTHHRTLLLLLPILTGAGWQTPLPAQQLTVSFATDWDQRYRGRGVLGSVAIDVDRLSEDRTRYGLRMMAWLPARADSLRMPRMGVFAELGRPAFSIFLVRAGVGFLGRDDPDSQRGARFAVMMDVLARVVRTRTVNFMAGVHTISSKGQPEVLGIVIAVDVRLWSGQGVLTPPQR